MKDQRRLTENVLKSWMLSHARKNALIDQMIRDIEILNDHITDLLALIEESPEARDVQLSNQQNISDTH